MPIKECNGLAGRLSIELRDPAGRVVEQRRIDNLITRAGRDLLARLFTGAAQGPELRIAVGSQGGEVQPTPQAGAQAQPEQAPAGHHPDELALEIEGPIAHFPFRHPPAR